MYVLTSKRVAWFVSVAEYSCFGNREDTTPGQSDHTREYANIWDGCIERKSTLLWLGCTCVRGIKKGKNAREVQLHPSPHPTPFAAVTVFVCDYCEVWWWI